MRPGMRKGGVCDDALDASDGDRIGGGRYAVRAGDPPVCDLDADVTRTPGRRAAAAIHLRRIARIPRATSARDRKGAGLRRRCRSRGGR